MIRFETVAAQWLEVSHRTISEDTWQKQRTILETYMLPALGNSDLSRFGKRKIDDYRRHIKQLGLAESTFRKHLTIIYGILNFAVQEGLLASFPELKVSYPKADRVIHRPNPGKLNQLLQKERGETPAVIILLAWQLGLMRNEIQALTWEQVDFERKAVHLASRSVPLPDDVASILKELRAEQSYTSGTVIRSVHNKAVKPEYVSMLARSTLTRYDMPEIRLMDLRHDFVIRSLQAYDLVEVAMLAGLKNADDVVRLYKEYLPAASESLPYSPAQEHVVGREALAARMSMISGLTQKDCLTMLNATVDAILQTLGKHESVVLDGFGTFSVIYAAERPRWNFHRNEAMTVPAHYEVTFTPCKSLRACGRRD